MTQCANHGFVVDTLQYLIKSGSRAGEGEKKESARGSVHWGCDYATALDIEVDPQRHRFGRREPDFALQNDRCLLTLVLVYFAHWIGSV